MDASSGACVVDPANALKSDANATATPAMPNQISVMNIPLLLIAKIQLHTLATTIVSC